MFLSRFRVCGYKCLADVDIPLTPIHVLVGRSDCGKTSLLEAISAFYGRFKTPAAEWFPAVANPCDLLTHGSSVPTIDLTGHWSERQASGGPPLPLAGYGYSVLVTPGRTGFGIIDQRIRPRAGEDPQSGLARVATAFPHAAGLAQLENPAAQAAFHDVVQRLLQPAPVYQLDPRRLAEPVRNGPSRSMAADGYGLPILLDEIARQHPEQLAEIEQEFCRLAPQYRGFCVQREAVATKKKSRRTTRPDAEEPRALGLLFQTSSGRHVAARDVSPGSLLLLALLTLARLPAPATMLLIEDLERGLCPEWLGPVTSALRFAASHSAGRPFPQVIFSTHSPAVLRFFQPEEVTRLVRPGDQPVRIKAEG